MCNVGYVKMVTVCNKDNITVESNVIIVPLHYKQALWPRQVHIPNISRDTHAHTHIHTHTQTHTHTHTHTQTHTHAHTHTHTHIHTHYCSF